MIDPSSERMAPFAINVLGGLDYCAMVAAALPDRYTLAEERRFAPWEDGTPLS